MGKASDNEFDIFEFLNQNRDNDDALVETEELLE